MLRLILLFFLLFIHTSVSAQNDIQYTSEDSTKIVELIDNGIKQYKKTNIILYYARMLKNIPYVANTLERNEEEKLVVNIHQLDCTTYVENVCALYLCTKNGKKQFKDFCNYLRLLRYENGNISYPQRLHYFSQWIENNNQKGFVYEIKTTDPPFSGEQKLNINYMSKHPDLYPAFNKHPELVNDIKNMERTLCGKIYKYIPKEILHNKNIIKKAINDGDIIAIVTNKAGLDTSHIGIAIWHDDGVHLLNASTIHKKVVEEPMTLYNYMKKHPSQIGIRVIRMF